LQRSPGFLFTRALLADHGLSSATSSRISSVTSICFAEPVPWLHQQRLRQ
jgi:hypothetical protein